MKTEPKKTQTPKSASERTGAERTCAGCGAKRPQHAMLRLAALGGSTPVVDREYSAPGRGTYLCFDGACWQRAQKRRAIERALKLRDAIPREVKDEIERLLARH